MALQLTDDVKPPSVTTLAVGASLCAHVLSLAVPWRSCKLTTAVDAPATADLLPETPPSTDHEHLVSERVRAAAVTDSTSAI